MNSKKDLAIKAVMAAMLCAMAYLIWVSMRDRVVGVGDTAPNFSIVTDQGRTITPTNFGGKILVLNFWASWCAPCVEEVPSLVQMQKALADAGVVVVGVSIDRNPKLYNAFIKRFQISFLTARDPDANISSDFGTYKIPETYIIDRSGKVVQKFVGTPQPPLYWSDPQLMSYIKSI